MNALFDDMLMIRMGWMLVIPVERVKSLDEDAANQLDKKVQKEFKKLLTINAKHIKLGHVAVATLLEQAALTVIGV